MRFLKPLEAHIIAGRLETDGVPVIVMAPACIDVAMTAEILVPEHLMHRARWVMSWPAPSDEELLFLATGELAGEDGP